MSSTIVFTMSLCFVLAGYILIYFKIKNIGFATLLIGIAFTLFILLLEISETLLLIAEILLLNA